MTGAAERRVGPLRADTVSGAAEVASRAARIVIESIDDGSLEREGPFDSSLTALVVAMLEAQPAMAPLVSLGRSLLEEIDTGGPASEQVERVRECASEFERHLTGLTEAVAKQTDALLPGGTRVLTLSNSSTVRAALLRAASRGHSLGAVCLESRPHNEGRALAQALAGAGLEVTYAVDSAVDSLVPSCDLVLLGSDSLGDQGFVNKIGSMAAARAGRSAGVPVVVLADSTKLLPEGYPQTPGAARPGAEVWSAPDGVTVWNHYFEVVPISWASAVVLEDGRWSPEELGQRRTGLDVPSPLRAWMQRLKSGRP